ncbi:MAG: hypothetical protein M1825_003471 [Sarcosagium campestre]|nr:MAG: hypothetical protein M1825_003471 [Sarcosagium campestre]
MLSRHLAIATSHLRFSGVPKAVPRFFRAIISALGAADGAGLVWEIPLQGWRNTRRVARYVKDSMVLATIFVLNHVTMAKNADSAWCRVRSGVRILDAAKSATNHARLASKDALGLVSTKEAAACPCGHRCPGVCGEQCPQEYCRLCSDKQDRRVDMLEFKSFGEVDLDETPIMVLACGHFFTTESLDGMVGMQEAYDVDLNGNFIGHRNDSGKMSLSVPQCPDCKCPIQQYTAQRFNRIINRAVLDKMSKRFVVSGKARLRQLDDEVGLLEANFEKSRAVVPEVAQKWEGISENHAERFKTLFNKVQGFINSMSFEHQPVQRLYDSMKKASRLKLPLENCMADLAVDDLLAVHQDHTIVIGGRVLLIKLGYVITADRIHTYQQLKTAGDVGDFKIQLASVINKWMTVCLKMCADLMSQCGKVNLPKFDVECRLYYGRLVLLYQPFCFAKAGEDDKRRAAEALGIAKAYLEEAKDVCTKEFQNAKALRSAAEEMLLLLEKEHDAPISEAELRAIKNAMLTGRDSIATHSGHWYNCANGHPDGLLDDEAWNAALEKELQDLRQKVNDEALLSLASGLHGGIKCWLDPDDPLGRSMLGGMHVHLRVCFEDGTVWLARIQRVNHTVFPDDLTNDIISSEYQTLRWLEGVEGVPTPRVHAFGLRNDSNAVGAAYMLIDKLPGRPFIADFATLEQKRKVFSALAKIQTRLADNPLSRIGSIISGYPGEPYVGTSASDRTGTLTRLGPFDDARAFYEAWCEEHLKLIADRQLYVKFPVHGYLAFCFLKDQARAGKLDDFDGEFESGPFVLKHTDDKGDHILVDEDFNITGLIDWTFARVVPVYEALGPSLVTANLEDLYEGRSRLSAEDRLLGEALSELGSPFASTYSQSSDKLRRFFFALGTGMDMELDEAKLLLRGLVAMFRDTEKDVDLDEWRREQIARLHGDVRYAALLHDLRSTGVAEAEVELR